MKFSFSKMMLTLSVVSLFALASCKNKEASTRSNDNSFEVNIDKTSQTNKDQNIITVDKPFISEDLSIEASTETIKSTVYFLVNDLKPIWGIDQYKTKGTDFTVFANLNDKVIPIILTGSRDGKACGTWNMNDGVQACYADTYSVLTVKFDPAKNPSLKNGLYTTKFNILAKGWHNSSYTKAIPIEVSLDIKK